MVKIAGYVIKTSLKNGACPGPCTGCAFPRGGIPQNVESSTGTLPVSHASGVLDQF
jgi:hypothetical protein